MDCLIRGAGSPTGQAPSMLVRHCDSKERSKAVLWPRSTEIRKTSETFPRFLSFRVFIRHFPDITIK